MRRWMLLTMVALGGLVACDGADSKPVAVARTAELGVEQVVDRHLAALGGVDRLKARRSLVVRGEYVEDGKVDSFTAYRERPNLLRKEGAHGGKPFVKVFDGKRGYIAEGGAGLVPMTAEHSAKMATYAAFDDALIDAAGRGHRIELVGLEEVKGEPAYHLQLTLAGGEVEQRWLDAESFLDVRHVYSWKDKEGAAKTKDVYFTDWREVDGHRFNFASEGEMDGKRSKVTIEKIEVDVAIDPAKFAGPAEVVAALP